MAVSKVLVVGPSWIGDMVMAQSLFKYLMQISPDVIIDVLAPAWALPVVSRMPEVRRGIPFPSRHGKLDLMMRIKTGLGLRKEAYQEAIIMPRSLKSMIPALFAAIPKRTAFKSHLGLTNNLRKYQKSRDQLYVRRLLALASDHAYTMSWAEIPRPILEVDQAQQASLLERLDLAANEYVVFAPGAEFGPSKQWPTACFSRLAEMLEKKALKVLIMGAAKESAIATSILQGCSTSNVIDLTGKTSLPEVIDLMAAAKTVVANDSGLMHLGYASGTSVVAIYGSSSPRYTPPLSDAARALQHPMDCQPCFARECRYHHYQCLKSITAQRVFDEIRTWH